MKPLVLELRTVPGPRAEVYVDLQKWEPDANLARLDNPPKTITDLKSPELREERLRQWVKDQTLKLEQSALRKRQSALDRAGRFWWTGQLVAVTLLDYTTGLSQSYSGEDEKALLLTLAGDLGVKWKDHYLIGKNIHEDFPFLTGRFMAMDIPLPRQLQSLRPVQDVHDLFGWKTSGSQRSTIKDYAFGLGLSLTDDEKPLTVYQMAIMGNQEAWGELEGQCTREAKVVGEIFRRYYQTWGERLKIEQISIEAHSRQGDDIPF